MNDWQAVDKAMNEGDYELAGNIYARNNAFILAYRAYYMAFEHASKEAKYCKANYLDPLNTRYIQWKIGEEWESYEKDCKRIQYKIKRLIFG